MIRMRRALIAWLALLLASTSAHASLQSPITGFSSLAASASEVENARLENFSEPAFASEKNPGVSVYCVREKSVFLDEGAPGICFYANANPLFFIDPDGRAAYDGHMLVTGYDAILIAKQLGLDPKEALRIAFYSQVADQVTQLNAINVEGNYLREKIRPNTDDLDAPEYLRSAKQLRDTVQGHGHAIGGSTSLQRAQAMRAAMSATDDADFGAANHAYGDSVYHIEMGQEYLPLAEQQQAGIGFGHLNIFDFSFSTGFSYDDTKGRKSDYLHTRGERMFRTYNNGEVKLLAAYLGKKAGRTLSQAQIEAIQEQSNSVVWGAVSNTAATAYCGSTVTTHERIVCDDDQIHEQTVDALSREVRGLIPGTEWPSFNAYDPGIRDWNSPAEDLVATFEGAIAKDHPELGDTDVAKLAVKQMLYMLRPEQQQTLLQRRAPETLTPSEVADAIYGRAKAALDRKSEIDNKGVTAERRNGNGQQPPR